MTAIHEKKPAPNIRADATAWARFTDYQEHHELVARVIQEPPVAWFRGADGARGLESPLERASLSIDMDLILLGHVNETTYTTVAFHSGSADPAITKGDTIPIGETYCRQEIAAVEPFLLRDAKQDPVHGTTFADHPGFRVHGLRAYAGAPVTLVDGTVFGTLCGVDASARPVSDQALEKLAVIASEVAEILDARLRTMPAPE